jgi:hypothetical protein
MPVAGRRSEKSVNFLPPLVFVTIRWKKAIGSPLGDPCSGFGIVVEEHTMTEYQVGSSGLNEPKPGTGKWHSVAASALCSLQPDEGENHVVKFTIRDLHLVSPTQDDGYRIHPQLTGKWVNTPFWRSDGRSFFGSLGFRQILPIGWRFKLTPQSRVINLDFDVVRRLLSPWMWQDL